MTSIQLVATFQSRNWKSLCSVWLYFYFIIIFFLKCLLSDYFSEKYLNIKLRNSCYILEILIWFLIKHMKISFFEKYFQVFVQEPVQYSLSSVYSFILFIVLGSCFCFLSLVTMSRESLLSSQFFSTYHLVFFWLSLFPGSICTADQFKHKNFTEKAKRVSMKRANRSNKEIPCYLETNKPLINRTCYEQIIALPPPSLIYKLKHKILA